jgi:hypothetical protein
VPLIGSNIPEKGTWETFFSRLKLYKIRSFPMKELDEKEVGKYWLAD